MPLTIGWPEIALRLVVTIVAAAAIGWNRGETGHPAGLRTTILVCLAAALSMIEANLLLDTRGKAGDSFAVLDLARFPLGILSGIGFIGAGAILRRGNIIEGVTTAATLWFVTMVGLCIGGGQIGLGVAATAIGYIVLSLVKRAEERLPLERRATLVVTIDGDADLGSTFAASLAARGYRVIERGARSIEAPPRRQLRYDLHWQASARTSHPGRDFEELARRPGVVVLDWEIGTR